MRLYFFWFCWAVTGLLACGQPEPPRDTTAEDVYRVRDSIRYEMLLRLGEAQQEIGRRKEMMRRRAYSEPSKEAQRLNNKADLLDQEQVKVANWITQVREDSVMGEWFLQQQEMNLLLERISHELNTLL